MLTQRDLEILYILTNKVRVLSISQIARTWWNQAVHPIQSAQARLQALESQGQIRCVSFSVHPEVALENPLEMWLPGQPEPDFGSLSYRAHARWTRPPVFERLVYATKTAAGHLGGFGDSPPDANHATHDMHLAAVFLFKRLHEPACAESWQSEDIVRSGRSGYDDKLPDAIVTYPIVTAIDFVGKYTKAKLNAFHKYCERENMAYELW